MTRWSFARQWTLRTFCDGSRNIGNGRKSDFARFEQESLLWHAELTHLRFSPSLHWVATEIPRHAPGDKACGSRWYQNADLPGSAGAIAFGETGDLRSRVVRGRSVSPVGATPPHGETGAQREINGRRS